MSGYMKKCRKCDKEVWTGQTSINNRAEYTYIKGRIHCIPCAIIVGSNADKVEMLEERINKLEKFIEDMIYYAPGGPGYSLAKEHYDEINKSN